MTDELRYERLAASISRTHSVVPRIHGTLVESWAQLYPTLIAPVFHHSSAVGDVHAAHLLNAVIMASVVIPAYLLSRDVTASRPLAAGVAGLSVAMSWIIYSAMLMTEVAAYPAFVWATLFIHRSLVTPSRTNDLLAVGGIVLAYFGRTALLTLGLIYPVAILLLAVRQRSIRGVLRAHAVVAVAYGVAVVAALVLALTGNFKHLYGIYAHYTGHADFATTAFWGSLLEHYATFSLGLGILPLVLGGAWLLSRAFSDPTGKRGAFAVYGALLVVVLPLQVTDFDVKYNVAFVHDRFFIYLVPILLCATACAVLERRVALWSAALATAVVAAGFLVGAIPAFTWQQFPTINPDTPASSLYRSLADTFGSLGTVRVLLVLATVSCGAATVFVRRRSVAVLAIAYLALASPFTAYLVIDRYFSNPGWSGRPVTAQLHGVTDWVDASVGGGAQVAGVPYPISSDWFVSQQFWRDLEFWNRSYTADIHYPEADVFEYTGFWFPKTYLRVDATSGAITDASARYAIQAVADARFRIRGRTPASTPNAVLIDAGSSWHLDWLSDGLYDDGWTRPGTTARIRVYALPGQLGAVRRAVDVALRAPDGVANRQVSVASNLGSWQVDSTPGNAYHQRVELCVPPSGFAVITVRAAGDSAIPGDLRSLAAGQGGRSGGVLVASIGLSDNIGGSCSANRQP